MIYLAEQRQQQAAINSLMREAFVRSQFPALGYNAFHAVRLTNQALRMVKASDFRLRGSRRLGLIRVFGLFGLLQPVFLSLPCLIFSLFMAVTGQ
jgi:hypothetical protein